MIISFVSVSIVTCNLVPVFFTTPLHLISVPVCFFYTVVHLSLVHYCIAILPQLSNFAVLDRQAQIIHNSDTGTI